MSSQVGRGCCGTSSVTAQGKSGCSEASPGGAGRCGLGSSRNLPLCPSTRSEPVPTQHHTVAQYSSGASLSHHGYPPVEPGLGFPRAEGSLQGDNRTISSTQLLSAWLIIAL